MCGNEIIHGCESFKKITSLKHVQAQEDYMHG